MRRTMTSSSFISAKNITHTFAMCLKCHVTYHVITKRYKDKERLINGGSCCRRGRERVRGRLIEDPESSTIKLTIIPYMGIHHAI